MLCILILLVAVFNNSYGVLKTSDCQLRSLSVAAEVANRQHQQRRISSKCNYSSVWTDSRRPETIGGTEEIDHTSSTKTQQNNGEDGVRPAAYSI